jgi:hypothetical protein
MRCLFSASRQPGCRHIVPHHAASTLTLTTFPLHTHPHPQTQVFRPWIQDVGIFALAKLPVGVAVANHQLFRARKLYIKGVEAVGSKSMDTKRAAPDDQVRSSRKKLKPRRASEPEIKSTKEKYQARDSSHQDQVFRFLDLPGGKSYKTSYWKPTYVQPRFNRTLLHHS